MKKPTYDDDAKFLAIAARYETADRIARELWEAHDQENIGHRKRSAELKAKAEAQEKTVARLFQQVIKTPATTLDGLVFKLRLGKLFEGIGGAPSGKDYNNGWGTDAILSAMDDAVRVSPTKARE